MKMSTKPVITWITPFAFMLLALTACNRPVPTPTTAPEAAVQQTAAAVTLEAQLTSIASGIVPSETAVPTVANPAQGGGQTSTEAPPATESTIPTITLSVSSCELADFVADVSIPDGTQFQAGEAFEKTWRLKNTGDCLWDSNYSLVFMDGDSMGGPAAVTLTGNVVGPGEEIDITVSLTAPFVPGTYRGNWKLRTPSGKIFGVGTEGDKVFWVEIEVVGDETPTPDG